MQAWWFMAQGSCLIAKGHLLAMSIAPWDMSHSPSSMRPASCYQAIKLSNYQESAMRLLDFSSEDRHLNVWSSQITPDLVIKWSPLPPWSWVVITGAGFLFQRGRSFRGPVREFCFCVFSCLLFYWRGPIRIFVFPARALAVFFLIAICPAQALASGTQNSILPA